MFAIAFDLNVSDLKAAYGEPYNNAYYEIKNILRKMVMARRSWCKYDFYNTQGSVYLTQKNDMATLFRAISALKDITWFKDSVRDIRAFRVEDWSDFTSFVKEEWSASIVRNKVFLLNYVDGNGKKVVMK